MSNEIIRVNDVSIRFNLAKEKVDNVKEYAIKKLRRQISFDEFYALRNVSFSIKKGDSFAIIGENGCGKSTLLKMISGIYYPTNGSVEVNGTISPLIELGAGFDMDLTARENIFLNGAVLGYSKEFMQAHFSEIMDFAELWDFVDVPLKNYSSGMVARLGFSIATVVVPDILIVDEILSVGDMNFQHKCEEKMKQMMASGATLIFVSHSIEQVKKVCRSAIWLNNGIVQMIGSVNRVADAYVDDMQNNAGRGKVHLEDILPVAEIPAEKPAQATPVPKKNRYNFISWLRALAALMVVYCHSFGLQFKNMELPNGFINFMDNHIMAPFAISDNLGFLGVVIFFIITGYLNYESLKRHSFGKYLGKKLARVFPPLFLALGCLWVLQLVSGFINGAPSYWAQFTLIEWIQAATLIGHFTGVSRAMIGVTWYLVPLIFYYFLSAVLKPLMLKRPKLYLLAMAGLVFVSSFGVSYLGGVWFMITSYFQYIPIIMFGQIIYMFQNGIIGRKMLAASFVMYFVLFMQNIRLYEPGNYYGPAIFSTSILLGLGLFLGAMFLNDYLKPIGIVRGLDKISISLYLSHYQVAQIAAPILICYMNTNLTMIATAIIIFAVAIGETVLLDLFYRLFRKREKKQPDSRTSFA